MDPLPPSDELRTKFAVACEKNFIIIAAVDSKVANERRLAAMTEAEIHDLMDRSVAYATQLISSRNWRNAGRGVLPEGCSASDLVQAAFQNILEGGKWDEDKPLWLVLKGYIRGTVKNLVESWENRVFSNADDRLHEEGECDWVSAVEQFENDEAPPESRLIREEDDELILGIIDSMEPGSPDRLIVEAIFNGASKRAEVIAQAGLNDKEFEAAKKRLQRFLENYRQELRSVHH
ncbi:MAG: hypothetical protein RLZZ505_2673 [Verrucomicrobiota bacterium]|jgi:hypothetical protein